MEDCIDRPGHMRTNSGTPDRTSQKLKLWFSIR